MTHVSFDNSTRFYRSFTATTMPVVPIDEVSAGDISELVSFYAADANDQGMLSRCRKFLNTEDGGIRGLELVFDDRYTYSDDGKLQSRVLVRADGTESRWFFDAAGETDRWRDISFAQDQITELEQRALVDIRKTGLCGNELAVSSVCSFLKAAKRVLKTATQDLKCTILLLVPGGDDEWLQLFPSNLFDTSLAYFAMALKPVNLEGQLPLMCLNREALAGRGLMFADDEIRALAAFPVCVNDYGTITTGVLALLSGREWQASDGERLTLLLKRIAVFVESLIELGRRDSCAPRTGDANAQSEEAEG